MRLIMTAMVRDEADIIASMLDHHLEQGVDHFVVTDNGSVDGTREILEDWLDGKPIRDEYLIVDGGRLAGTGAASYTASADATAKA